MNGFLALLDALKAGHSLANSATWKHRQNAVAALVAVLGGAGVVARWAGVQIDLAPEDVAAIAGGVAAAYGVLNGVLTTATSDKVGLPSRSDAEPPTGADR